MPFKLIGIIIVLLFVTLFTGFNVGDANRCNVWLFHTFQNVPVFMPMLISFVAGLVVMIPFMFGRHRITDKDVAAFENRKKKMEEKLSKKNKAAESDTDSNKNDDNTAPSDSAHSESK